MSAPRELSELRAEARRARGCGDLESARAGLVAAAGHTSAREEDYVALCSELRDVLEEMGDYRAALTVDWYAGTESTQQRLASRAAPVDRARTFLALAERRGQDERARGLHAQAADEYEAAGLIAQAAIARERGGDLVRARALWSRLAQRIEASSTDLYAAGLARFNLARTSRSTGDARAAHEAVVAAVRLLEEAADRYETIGQRERAFDCFQVLIAIGRESRTFEHVIEGYVNVIRILREDHLRYYALQTYEEAVAEAETDGELSAAATLARELAAYARNEGLDSVAAFATLTEARLWEGMVVANERRGAPAELSENALLAAVSAYAETEQYQRVGGVYRALAALPLEAARRAHYARAAGRYVDAQDLDTGAAPLAAHLRHEVSYPDVWHIDLVEWEQHGSAAEAAGDVLLDRSSWSEVTRRRAMLARLTALEVEAAERAGSSASAELCVRLAGELALVELYAILSPLEHLLARPEREVRLAVVRALSRFLYKRTFISLRAALADDDPALVRGAALALEELRFPHAFDPLARIYRETQSPSVRASVLKALAKIDTVEAAEMLLAVLVHDGSSERAAAVEALKRGRGTKFIDLARDAVPRLPPSAQAAVRDILGARHIAA